MGKYLRTNLKTGFFETFKEGAAMTLSTILIWVFIAFIVYLFYLAMKGTKVCAVSSENVRAGENPVTHLYRNQFE